MLLKQIMQIATFVLVVIATLLLLIARNEFFQGVDADSGQRAFAAGIEKSLPQVLSPAPVNS